MYESPQAQSPRAAVQDSVSASGARALYFELAAGTPGEPQRARAAHYLAAQLASTHAIECTLPDDPAGLAAWMTAGADEVGQAHSAYLAGRRSGEPRRYFPTRAHALAFLQRVAPTKLVDGAWLYGVLERWQDAAFRPLITTYLEELGSGVPEKNHVVLYQKLLAAEGCEQWRELPDTHFVQGAIQLALACNAEQFLPELIGFNLGYEQLPLHLLVTAYELNELGIDPYYFVLHVTVDNASSGHALKAIQALHALTPRVGDPDQFYRRVQNGFRLNELGAGTNALIAAFDLEQELVELLARKSAVGKNMHSDYCRVGGRTVNDWLSAPAQVPAFLAQLVQAGWIQRGAPAEQSRFWRLVHGESADMFGVFSGYEQEVLRAWIEHPKNRAAVSAGTASPAPAPRTMSFRARRRAAETGFGAGGQPARPSALRPLLRSHGAGPAHGFGAELRLLEQKLAHMDSKAQAMQYLQTLMSPSSHHTAAGLMATRIFQRMLD